MRYAIILFACACFAQVVPIDGSKQIKTTWQTINSNDAWLNTNKAGLGTCPTNQVAVQTTTGGVVCVSLTAPFLPDLSGTYQVTKYVPQYVSGSETIADGNSQTAKWMSADRKKVYCGDSLLLSESTDGCVTNTTIKTTLGGTIYGVRETGDGELLVSIYNTPGELWRSTGYPQRGSQATWSKVLTASGGAGVANYFQGQWGMSCYQAICVVSEYGTKTTPTNARYVYLSTDYGKTYSQILDIGATDGTHVHGVAYDPWWDAIWVVSGDYTPQHPEYQVLRVSFDRGSHWTVVSTSTQYVGILPMPGCILLTTDGTPNGVHRIPRTADRSVSSPVVAYLVDSSSSLTYLGTMPFRAQGPDMPALLPFAESAGTGPGLLVSTYDGYTFNTLWQDTISYTGKGPQYVVGPTATGKYVGGLNDGRQARNSLLTIPAAPVQAITGMLTESTSALNAALNNLAQSAGNYYYATPSAATTTGTRVDATLYASPLYIPRPVILDKIGLEVTGAGSANSVIRLCLYGNNSVGQPGSLILDAGTIDGTSATYQELTISQSIATPGWYWVAAAPQGAPNPTAPTLRISTGVVPGMGSATASSVSAANAITGFSMTSVAAGCPASFVISGSSGTIPRVLVRVQY